MKIEVFDAAGRRVAMLVNAGQNTASRSVVWNANVASGTYFYRLEVIPVDNVHKKFVETKRMELLR